MAGVALRGGKIAVVTAEIERAGPIAAGRFAVADAFQIKARFVIVIAAIEAEVIGDRRQDVIVTDLAPAIQPVDVGDGRLRQAAPTGRARNRAQRVVAGKELWRSIF